MPTIWAGRRGAASFTTIAMVLALAIATVAGCSNTSRSAEAYCAQLAKVTGPDGSEAIFAPGDSDRLPALVDELHNLLDRAPDEIATTTSAIVEFFETYLEAPRDERRTLLATEQRRLAQASDELTAYALDTCGLFLQRAVPTPIPTSDPGVDVGSD